MARRHGRTASDSLPTGILRWHSVAERATTQIRKPGVVRAQTQSSNSLIGFIATIRFTMEVSWTLPRIRREERDLCRKQLMRETACDVQQKRREPKHDDR